MNQIEVRAEEIGYWSFVTGWLVPVILLSCGMGLLVWWAPGWNGLGAPDFQADIVSARALVDGLDPYGPQPLLRERYGFPRVGSSLRVEYNPHFPVAIVTAVPFALPPYAVGLPAYRFVQVLTMAVAWWWAVRTWWRPGPAALGTGMLIGAWPPFWQGLDWGGPPGLLTLAILATWRLTVAGSPVAAGIATALAAGLRLPALGVTAAWARWDRARIITSLLSAGAIALAALSAVRTSPITWLERAASVENYIAVGASVSSFLKVDSTGAAFVALAGLAVAWFVARRLPDPDSSIAFGLCLAVATFPLGWFHYDVPLLLVLVWIIGTAQKRLPALVLAVAFFTLAGIPAFDDPGPVLPVLRMVGRLLLATGVGFAAVRDQRRSTSLRNLPV